VTLCGHATLASALVLFTKHPKLDRIEFNTRWSGTLYVERVPGDALSVEMSLPSLPTSALAAINTGAHDDLALVTRVLEPVLSASDILRAYRLAWTGFPGVIVELDPSVDLARLPVKPDTLVSTCLASLTQREISPGFTILTHAKPDESVGKLRIDSRVFAPGVGVDEDSVVSAGKGLG
jgi:predicted PhzF superfamily epimerase YddE/YHI9